MGEHLLESRRKSGAKANCSESSRLELKRRSAICDAIHEKPRQGQSLDLADRLIAREFFRRLQYDTE